VPSGKAENLIEANELPTKKFVPKQDISYRDSEIKGFAPGQRAFGSRQSFDERHGSIIRNISSASSANSQTYGDTNWENCKHRKSSDTKDYCVEYHSQCFKEKCKKARK
jgi:hypothetical protein